MKGHSKNILRHKVISVIIGVIFCAVLLEAGLRAGGFLFLSLQEHRNKIVMLKKGTYRILCLGESTTASGGSNAWPNQLDAILNQRNPGIRFSVINGGRVAANTPYIVSHLEENLNKYQPDMVITMMGINDTGGHVPYEDMRASRTAVFLKSFRLYKLVRLLWLHILNKAEEAGLSPAPIVKPAEYDTKQIRPLRNTTLSHKTAESNSLDGSSYVELGRSYLGQNKFKEAEETLRKAININHRDDKAYVQMGRAYRLQGRYTEAEHAFKDALILNPRNDWAYVELGILYGVQGKYPQAEEAFRKALEFTVNHYTVYIEMGHNYVRCLKYPQAEEAFRKALELSPQDENAYLELGWCYGAQRKNNQAVECLEEALRINPGNHRTYLELAQCYAGDNRYPQAEEAFNKAAELDPESEGAYLGLARCYSRDLQYPQAEKMLQKALAINSRNDSAYVELGILYGSESKYPQAEEAFKKAVVLNPGNDRSYTELGWYYLEQKKYVQAEQALQRAVGLNKNNVKAFLKLGDLYLSQHRLDQAEKALKKAIELDPDNRDGYAALTVLFEQSGRHERMQDLFQKADIVKSGYYSSVTEQNYLRLRKILDEKGIKLVCVQYPMRSLEPLKKIFGTAPGITFVDNEKIFKEAIHAADYSVYFSDMFGGEFGHCTNKGNRLLAENIADRILKECFGKR